MAKYPWIIKKGEVRPKLEHITPTLLICPKCKTQYFAKDFWVSAQQVAPPAPPRELLRIPLWVRDQAERFTEFLRLKGFHVHVTHHDDLIVVDFYDPELRRMLTEAGAIYDREKSEIFAESVEGSLEFQPTMVGRHVLVSGEIPATMLRPPTARGYMIERVRIPEDITVAAIHYHAEDRMPATHLHVTGMDVNVRRLADFISELSGVSKEFILKREL